MSNALNGSVAPFCHSQDRPGGVSVAVFDQPAGLTGENAFVQHQPLGSRKASAARHRRVGGLHQHHLPASPHGILDQGSLNGGHGSIGCLASHRRLGEKLRVEILNGDGLVVRHNLLGPDATRVGVPALRGLGDLRRLALGALVALGLGVPPGSGATRHFPLRLCQLSRRALPVPDVRQVVGWVGRGRSGGHAPVDADGAADLRRGLDLAADDERGVPVSEVIAVDPDRGWLGGQVAGPDNGHTHALGQDQATLAHGEPTLRVFHARLGLAGGLERWFTSSLDLEGVVVCLGEGAQLLLLGYLGALAEPVHLGPLVRESLGQDAEGDALPGAHLSDGVIPQVPAAVPLGDQCIDRLRTWAQAVLVAHCLFHTQHYTAPRYVMSTDPTTTSSAGAANQRNA